MLSKFCGFLASLSILFCSLYWAKNNIGQHPSVIYFIAQVEDGYQSLNNKITSMTIQKGVKELTSFLGLLTFVFFILFILFLRFDNATKGVIIVFYSLSIISIFWASLYFCINFKKIIKFVKNRLIFTVASLTFIGIFYPSTLVDIINVHYETFPEKQITTDINAAY